MILWEQVAYLANDEKRRKAFEALRSSVGTIASQVARTKNSTLLEIAALGGPFGELRAQRMRQSATMIVEDFSGDLDTTLDLPTAKAKKVLMRFPMIGEPGAEKILLFSGSLLVLPLESNGLRVLTRLGVVREAKSYSTTYREARKATLEMLPADTAPLQQAHLLLRRHGMELCFRNAPACHSCPLRQTCPASLISEP